MIQKYDSVGINKKLDQRYDLFICSASYETRCLSISNSLNKAKIGYALVASNATPVELGASNLQKLLNYWEGKSREVVLDFENPLVFADSLISVFGSSEFSTPNAILVDITTFTREALLILIKFLHDKFQEKIRIDFVYNAAGEYSLGVPTKEKWLSKGIKSIRSILGYPGNIDFQKKNHLIVLLGFEPERAQELIDSFEPSFLSIGYGSLVEGTNDQHHAINKERFHTLRSIYPNVVEFEFSCTNPVEVRNLMELFAKQHNDRNIIIAPMNNKLSTYGVALAAIANPAIQVCYASATLYNHEGYSTPGDDYYFFHS